MGKPEHAFLSEYDNLNFNAIRRRFMALNRERIRRMQESLAPQQRSFFDMLPLILHLNDPNLPGYVSETTPSGISDYSPSKSIITEAKRLFRPFTYRRRALRIYNVNAIFLMGSSGTIAHSEKSDFDIWLCYSAGLPVDRLQKLKTKALELEKWATSLNLEVHFFVLNADEFEAGKHQALSEESSGTSQHHLLLDEFYRTSLLLAGLYPAWWLVPAEKENHYHKFLQRQIQLGRLNENEFIDFGGIAEVPAGEFFGATLWQLYKAIDSPYKSTLKIQLLEIYATEFPHIDLLCHRFKRIIHSGEVTLDQLDPYVMMADKVQEYLVTQGNQDRLELARRCFYFKVNARLSRKSHRRSEDWRAEVMRELATQWGWDDPQLLLLDSRQSWKIDRVIDERRKLVKELTHSYDVLSDFGRKHAEAHLIDPRELNILGRKLYTAFERKAGKIELLNPGISTNLAESQISIHYSSGPQESWLLFRGQVNAEESRRLPPLKRTRSILELLAWCHFNGLISAGTRTALHSHESELAIGDIKAVEDSLRRLFPDGQLAHAPISNFAKPPSVARSALFINLGVDPMRRITRDDRHIISDRTDALSYGGVWKNLALTFEQILVTSWQEILTFHYKGIRGLLEAICNYANWAPISKHRPPPPIITYSFSSLRSSFIAQRIGALFADVMDCFYQDSEVSTKRYLLQAERSFYVLYTDGDTLKYLKLDNLNALLDYLGDPARCDGTVTIDRMTLRDSPLSLIYERQKEGVIQFYYLPRGKKVEVYIVDECGSLFTHEMPYYESGSLINQFGQFFEAVCWRSGKSMPKQIEDLFDETVEYHLLRKKADGEFEAIVRSFHHHGKPGGYFSIQVLCEAGEAEDVIFTVYCEDREFSSLQYGDKLFTEVVQHILHRRTSSDLYPIYITDIDISPQLLTGIGGNEQQTIHYLRYKQQFETRLSSAMQKMA